MPHDCNPRLLARKLQLGEGSGLSAGFPAVCPLTDQSTGRLPGVSSTAIVARSESGVVSAADGSGDGGFYGLETQAREPLP
jgi:hypothetical protein